MYDVHIFMELNQCYISIVSIAKEQKRKSMSIEVIFIINNY